VNNYVSSVQLHVAGQCVAPLGDRRRLAGLVSKVCLVLSLGACAGAPPTGAKDPFRAIQREEQQVALGQAALAGDGDCQASRAAAEDQVCAASKRLCELASDLDDADAQARCARVSDACTGARERTRERCATKPPQHDG
jgi:hypothetical protein